MTAICGVCGDPYAGHGLAGHVGIRPHRYRVATDAEREKHAQARDWEHGVGHGIAPITLDDGTKTADAIVTYSLVAGGLIFVTLERENGTRYRGITTQAELDKRADSAVR